MKLKRICALALCSALCAGLLTLTASAENTDSGLHLTKTVTPVDGEDRTYDVTLEAYATGSAFNVAPEIVLVLDESSSMDTDETTYVEVYAEEVNKHTTDKTTYYILDKSGNFLPVQYCSEDAYIGPFGGSCNGWYTGDHFTWGNILAFHLGDQYRPMRYEDDPGNDGGTWGAWSPDYYPNPVQFYKSVTNKGSTKLEALKTAAKDFVEAVHDKAVKDNVDYKVSVIGYKDESTSGTDSTKIDLTEVQTDTGLDAVTGAIDKLSIDSTSGSMANALGLAQSQFTNNEKSQKVVVVFSSAEIDEINTANDSISAAKTLKAKSITIYTVGMMDLADPTLDITDSNIKWNDISSAGNKNMLLTNARLQAVSSNYPNATACGSFGTGNISGGYYKKGTNQSALTEILKAINKNLVVNKDSKLGTEAVLKDEVSKYFEIVTDSATAHSERKTTTGWETTSDAAYTVTAQNGVVTATGFDYSGNWVGDSAGTAHGKKLVVTYRIKAKDAFLGGNGVDTQTNKSGVYANSGATSALESFTDPKVNVAIPALTVTAQDKNVYLTNTLTADQMTSDTKVTITATGQEIKFGEGITNYGLAEWQTAYIKTIALSATETAPLFENAKYTVDCKVTPKTIPTGGIPAATFTSGEANINVFKPTLTYDDYTVYLGGSVPTFTPSITWMHGTIKSTDTNVTMVGTEPTLGSYEYSKDSAFTACTDVRLNKIYIGQTDVTSHVTVTNAGQKFTVHVLKPTLSATDTIIYYGTSTNLNNCVKIGEWKCDEHSKTKADAGNLSAPDARYSFSDNDGKIETNTNIQKFAPYRCVKVTATATVGGETWQGNSETFWVHVVKPNFTFTDVTIYRGNPTDLTKCVTYDKNEAWVCYGTDNGHSNMTKNDGDKPTITYHFSTEYADKDYISNHTVYKPTECTKLYFIPEIESVTYNASDFTVHVLQPVFTATPKDAWADYGTKVDLSASCVSSVLSWEDQTSYKDHESSTVAKATGEAPTLTDSGTVLNYTFTPKDTSVTLTTEDDKAYYTVVKADKDFTVTGLTYRLSNDLTGTVQANAEGQKTLNLANNKADFTVHVNKFKLTIERNWNTSDPTCYQQDAIFTVNDGSKDFKVVIPKEKDNVTIGGLFCGQNYTVTADSGWSWRYNTSSSTSETVSHTHKDDDGNAAVYNKAPEDGCTVTKSFTNTLNTSKMRWLSGDWWCQNTCDGTKITQNKRKRTT